MRTKRTVNRRRRSPRLRAQPHLEAARIPADMPRCVTCGQPLARLPRYLGSALGAGGGFQCHRCFYANAAPPSEPAVVSSERARLVSELVYGVPEPATPGGSED
jgi:hypothetical protein